MKPSVGFVALGCAKNTVDMQVMAGHLIKGGFAAAPSPECADVVLVNTCAFIESAREEAAREILRALGLKRAGKCRAVVVTGCLVQRYREKLAKLFSEVDAFVGIDALENICDAVSKALSRNSAAPEMFVPPGQAKEVFDPPVPALRFSGRTFAYLKIAEGCAHRCAYCAIPLIRGNYRSRDMAAILAEAKELVATGARELNIIAQDPMLYGCDTSNGGLTALLNELDKIDGDFWIRVLYSYPSEISEDFLEWMRTSPHAARYIDVPLQHTHPAVLRKMNRGAAVAATLSAAERLRAAVPGVTLRTTLMTGFPGETPARFAKMLADVESMAFDHLGAFAYSPEEGTSGAAMSGRPSRNAAEERLALLMAAQRKVWRKKARAMKGRVYKGLVTAPGVARLESQAPEVDGVVFTDGGAAAGEFVRIRIEGARGYDLTGRIMK